MIVKIKKNENKFVPIVLEITFEHKCEVNSIIEANKAIQDGDSVDDGTLSADFYSTIEALAEKLENL